MLSCIVLCRFGFHKYSQTANFFLAGSKNFLVGLAIQGEIFILEQYRLLVHVTCHETAAEASSSLIRARGEPAHAYNHACDGFAANLAGHLFRFVHLDQLIFAAAFCA
jgi:hypothetical protein